MHGSSTRRRCRRWRRPRKTKIVPVSIAYESSGQRAVRASKVHPPTSGRPRRVSRPALVPRPCSCRAGTSCIPGRPGGPSRGVRRWGHPPCCRPTFPDAGWEKRRNNKYSVGAIEAEFLLEKARGMASTDVLYYLLALPTPRIRCLQSGVRCEQQARVLKPQLLPPRTLMPYLSLALSADNTASYLLGPCQQPTWGVEPHHHEGFVRYDTENHRSRRFRGELFGGGSLLCTTSVARWGSL